MRYAAFFFAVLAGVLELAGAIMGLGIAGVGFVFGSLGQPPASIGVGIALVCAIATIFLGTVIMFVRDARPIGLMLIAASIGAGMAGGPWVVPGMAAGLIAATLTFRLDLTRPLV
ncbi:MAG: hypothetical protein ABIR11_06735 [Candidatus Limnocylindrales bacterium]